jgi:hypothetical protein
MTNFISVLENGPWNLMVVVGSGHSRNLEQRVQTILEKFCFKIFLYSS